MTAVKKIKIINSDDRVVKNTFSKDQLAKCFCRISNHEELFRIGKGFLQEVHKGVRSFAFTSVGCKTSQERTILGLCCYFDQNANYRIVVISDHLSQGVFGELVDCSTSNCYSISGDDESVKSKSFHHHFDFIDYSELSKFSDNHLYAKSFEIEVKKILENYDLIFWDIPEMEAMKKDPHFHYRISTFYESMTVIVQNTTSGKQIESIKNFFSNYNINVTGVLFDSSCLIDKPRRKKMLGLF